MVNLRGANILGYADAVMRGAWAQTLVDMMHVQAGRPTREATRQAQLRALHVERQERAAREAGLL